MKETLGPHANGEPFAVPLSRCRSRRDAAVETGPAGRGTAFACSPRCVPTNPRFKDTTFSSSGLAPRFALSGGSWRSHGWPRRSSEEEVRAARLCLTSALSATLCLILVRLRKTGRIENKRLRRHLWPTYGCNDGQVIP